MVLLQTFPINGHIILREDGGLSITKGIKNNVIEPHLEVHPLLPSQTSRKSSSALHQHEGFDQKLPFECVKLRMIRALKSGWKRWKRVR